MTSNSLEALRALLDGRDPHNTRTSRGLLAAIILVGLVAGAALTWSVVRERGLLSRERAAQMQLDRLMQRAVELATSVRLYGVTRDPETQFFPRADALMTSLTSDARALDASFPGVAMAPRATLAAVLQGMAETLEHAKANIDTNKPLMALDALETNGKQNADALETALADIRAGVAADVDTERARWRGVGTAALAIWALTWLAGLAWLARSETVPATVPAAAAAEPGAAPPAGAEKTVSSAVAPAPAAEPAELPLSVPARPNLEIAAATCEAASRITDASELPAILDGAARALGAAGVALWIQDGDALVAAAMHGYPEGLARRVGRVPLSDTNLITRAWQSRASQFTSEPGRRAALAAPIASSHHDAAAPVGVLTAEMPADATVDDSVVAAARIIAAQLSASLTDRRDDVAATEPAGAPSAKAASA